MKVKKIYFLFIAVCFFVAAGFAQTVTVTGADGVTNAGSPYTTLRAAFNSINGSTQAGNVIVITITGTTTETLSAALNQSVGPWTSLTINPVGAASVTGNIAGHLIELNGADNVTINGLNTGGNSLTINNTSSTNSSTIRFVGDACNNTISNCNLLGSTSVYGVVYFNLGTITGNDDNTVTQCNITASSGGTPLHGILSIGTSAVIDNSNNTISGNNISNFFNSTFASSGIYLFSNSSAWTITNNRFYQTATRIITVTSTYSCIWITSGSGYTISNNVIGFAASNGTGTTNMIGLTSGSLGGTFPGSFTAGGTANGLRYSGITCSFTAGGTVSSIQNNTIAGIALYTGSSVTVNNGILCGIQVTSGNADIGTVTGNTIGSASGSGSIYAASTSAGAIIAGIYCTSTNTINIQNNTIGGIDVSGTTAGQATGFKGIDVAGTGTFTVSNNNVGNATVNNIRTGYLLTGANLSNTATTPTAASGGGTIRGIVSSATGATVDISNNTIRGVQISGNASSYIGISATGTVTSAMNITANQVGNSGTNAVTFPFTTGGTIVGISVLANAPVTTNLNNNSIYGITCPGANSITGITALTGAASATLNINNNSFTNTVVSGVGSSTPITGITNSAIVATLNITGNVIRNNSSTATSGNFNGIVNSGAVVNAINISNNQLGNAVGGALTLSAATTGGIIGISNTNAASTATTVNMNSNSLDGFSVVNTGQIIFIQNTAGNAGVANFNNNQLGTVTGSLISFSGVQGNNLSGLYNPNGNAAMAISIQNNDFRGIVQTATGTASQSYIDCQAPAFSTLIHNNTFTNLGINSSGVVYLISKGGSMASGASSTITNNRIAGSFSKTASGGFIYGYYSTGSSVSGSSVTISGNNFSNVTITGTSWFFGIEESEGFGGLNSPTKIISANTISNITMGSGFFYGLSVQIGENINISLNSITNVTSSGRIYGISIGPVSGLLEISYNTISSLSTTGQELWGIVQIGGGGIGPSVNNIHHNNITGLSGGVGNNSTYGIFTQDFEILNIYDNDINSFTATAGQIQGISCSYYYNIGTTLNVCRNNIYNLQGGLVTGMDLARSAITVNVYNNFISELKAPNANSSNAVIGVNVTTNNIMTNNLYNNSIYLNASSTGTNFGTSGIYHLANTGPTTNVLNMVNNIVVNTSTANGTGVTAAFWRSGTALNNYTATSDYNLFYAGTPGVKNLIYYDNTNSDQTLAAYQTRVSPRDANSISLMPAFTSSTDLHLTGANCGIDGRGIPVVVTEDIDGETRDANTPDIGADEFTATYGSTLAGVVGSAVCDNKHVSPGGTIYGTSACELIARVTPAGGNPVAGKINVCVTRDATQQYFNGDPYVQRHYDIEPATSNQTTTSATINLVFTDAEFVLYNSNNPAWPPLPTNGAGNTVTNRNNLKITQFHGAATTNPSTPGNYPGTRVLITPGASNVLWNGSYWEVSFNVAGFSGFYVHTNAFNSPLPVVVNYLTGRKQGSNHLLNWKVTCTSTPRATMTLERSSDARNYSGIYTITADAARCQQPFDHTDASPLKGMNYYRLKIVDADGKVTYSTTVALLNAVKGFDIIGIAPNPVVSNNFKLNVAGASAGKIEIVIFDMQGRLVNRQTLSLIAGFNSLPVNVANLAPGTYTIKGSMGGDQSKPVRFIKQ